MSADLLRRAAAKIRETAQVATPGPWEATAVIHPNNDRVGIGYVQSLTGWPAHALRSQDVEHIALRHPGIASAVADILEERARWYDAVLEGQICVGHSPEFAHSEAKRQVAESLILARLILKEEA